MRSILILSTLIYLISCSDPIASNDIEIVSTSIAINQTSTNSMQVFTNTYSADSTYSSSDTIEQEVNYLVDKDGIIIICFGGEPVDLKLFADKNLRKYFKENDLQCFK